MGKQLTLADVTDAKGLDFGDRTPAHEEWSDIMSALFEVQRVWRFYVGDAMLYGEDRFGEEAWQAVPTVFTEKSVSEAMRVARAVPKNRRREKLSWSHHHAVAACDAKTQNRLLKLAEREGWTVPALRAEVKKARGLDGPTDEPELPLIDIDFLRHDPTVVVEVCAEKGELIHLADWVGHVTTAIETAV